MPPPWPMPAGLREFVPLVVVVASMPNQSFTPVDSRPGSRSQQVGGGRMGHPKSSWVDSAWRR